MSCKTAVKLLYSILFFWTTSNSKTISLAIKYYRPGWSRNSTMFCSSRTCFSTSEYSAICIKFPILTGKGEKKSDVSSIYRNNQEFSKQEVKANSSCMPLENLPAYKILKIVYALCYLVCRKAKQADKMDRWCQHHLTMCLSSLLFHRTKVWLQSGRKQTNKQKTTCSAPCT